MRRPWPQGVRRTIPLLLAAVLASLGVACWYMGRPAGGLPYHDHFAEGKMEEWAVYGGSWQIADGEMSNNSDDSGTKVVAGSESLTNYKLDADVSLTSTFGDTGVMVRVTDPEAGVNAFNGYYVGVRLPDELRIGKMDFGYRPLQHVRIAHGVRPYVWYHLTVRAAGCRLSAEAYDGAGNLIASSSVQDEDECDRHGAFGLRSFAAGGKWRRVTVERLQ